MSDFSHLKAYNGSEPYIFISYAHADSQRVLPVVEAMQNRGFRIWFDMGIEAGTEWSNNIAKHLRECDAFLFFTSPNSVASENCLDEVAYAKSHQKPSLMIFLEETVILPEGTEMQTARFQRMYLNRQKTLESAVEKIVEAPILRICQEGAMAAARIDPPVHKAQSENPKKKLWMWIGIGAGVMLVVGALLLILLLNGDKPEPQNNRPNLSSTMPTGSDPLELSDKLMDFTFMLEGKLYQLPADIDAFSDAGWSLDTTEPVMVRGLGYYSVDAVCEDKMIRLEMHNPSGNARALEECCVSGICIYEDDGVVFQIAKDFQPGVKAEEVESAFGLPQYRYDGEETINLEYNQDDNAVVFHCSINGKGMPYIRMYRRDIPPEDTQNSTQRPAYLDEYVEPEELGDELESGIFQLEGDLFAMPVPLEALLEKGWVISEGSGEVVAYGEVSLKLTMGDVSVDVTVFNASDFQTAPENCIVKRISVYDSDDAYLKLPNGIDIDSTAADVESAMLLYVEEDGVNDYGDEVFYTAKFDDVLTIQVCVQRKNDKVRIIDIYF